MKTRLIIHCRVEYFNETIDFLPRRGLDERVLQYVVLLTKEYGLKMGLSSVGNIVPGQQIVKSEFATVTPNRAVLKLQMLRLSRGEE